MLTAENEKTLTPEQEQTLLDMGFKKKTVKTKATLSYILWEKKIRPKYIDAPLDAIIVVHIIDGKIYRVSNHQDTYAPKDVTDEVEATNAVLREKGIV